MGKTERISLDQIRQMDIVDYLSGLGYQTAKIRGNDYWYLSPLQEEKTPSFKVDRSKNLWYDHGKGIGGNFIDLAINLHNCTVKDLYHRMNENQPYTTISIHKKSAKIQEEGPKIEVIRQHSITAYSLTKYLQQRRIDWEVADQYCKELEFNIGDHRYMGIGLQNDLGGWAIRNPYMKCASTPNGITTILNSPQKLLIIEGSFDFLSFQTIFKNQPESQASFIILNSLSHLNVALPLTKNYPHVGLLFDNDKAGDKAAKIARTYNPAIRDERHLFIGYKDLNNWHMELEQKKQLSNIKLKPR